MIDQAINSVERLYEEVIGDLEEGEGIRWMRGHLDWKRACLIGDYFLSGMLGIKDSLLMASRSAKNYREREFADNQWLKSQWQIFRKSGVRSQEAYFASMTRGESQTNRELDIIASAQHCFFHLAQALDRLSATVAVSIAIRTNILHIDWTVLEKLAREGLRGHELRQQPPQGTEIQRTVLKMVLDEPPKHGPEDWLPWLIRSRNTVAHRSPKMNLNLLTEDERRRQDGMMRPFPAQPGWPETEAMLRSNEEGLWGLVLNDQPAATLEGLVQSTAGLVGALLEECITVIRRRRSDPTVLIQTGGQWPTYFSQKLLKFKGYGARLRVAKFDDSQMMINPSNAARMQAFRIDNKWLKEWKD